MSGSTGSTGSAAGDETGKSRQNIRSVTPATQEIRLATTMTGGVSLAIWMGGVAREFNLLAQASRQRSAMQPGHELPNDTAAATETDKVRLLYLRLINLLDVIVEIDVLSGTSAGGINAALLAYSRVTGKDLGRLRELWLDMGALLSLLRNPADSDVPSLLLGDAQMLAGLAKAIPALGPGPADAMPAKKAPPTTLFVTTTLLTGETSRFTDSFGTLVQDVDHHGLFRFTETQLTEANAGALALASRSSASFPGAFEPSFIPFTVPIPADGPVPARPAMADFSNITRAHWAADGGVLDNQPIGPLLQTVFDRAAERVVRRVLLYVVPSAGPAPDLLKPQAGDEVSKPYGLLDGLLRDVGAVKTQSIAADLKAIWDHNSRIAVRTDMRLQLAALAARLPGARPAAAAANGVPAAAESPGPAPTLLTTGLLTDYCAREAAALAQPVVAALMRQLTTWPAAGNGASSLSSIPTSWQQALRPGSAADQACNKAIVGDLSGKWGTTIPADFAVLARFGRPAYDGGKAVALSVIRAAYPLATTPGRRLALAKIISAIHAAFRPQPRPDLVLLVRACCETDKIRKLELQEAATKIAARYLDELSSERPAAPPASSPPTHAGSAGNRDQADLPGSGESPGGALERAWQRLGRAFTGAAASAMLDELAGARPAGPGEADIAAAALNHSSSAADQLRSYLGYLRIEDGEAAVAARLFALFAAQRAMLPVDADVEQPVELIQVSADTRTSLDPARSTAASKLTGEQLHHFGAFFKQSWRANDWMWGRLDGAGWLVHVLLDPRRVQAWANDQPDTQADQPDTKAGRFMAELLAIGADQLASGEPGEPGIRITPEGSPDPVFINAVTVCDELSFLDAPGQDVPASLPLTAMWVARVWQLHIAADELPTLARTIIAPNNQGARSKPGEEQKSATESAWADEVGQARKAGYLLDNAGELLRSNPVPGETLAGEAGSPLMIRTVTKAAATTVAAVHSVQEIPAVVRPAVSWARTMTLAGYRLTTKIKPVPRWLIGVGLICLFVGVVAAFQQSALFGLGGLALASAGAYLIVLGAWQMSPLVLGGLISTTIVLAVGSLTLPVVRHKLFGKSAADTGWLGKQVHWIGASPWHPLAVLLAIGLAVGLIAVLSNRIRHLPDRWWTHFRPWAAIIGLLVLITAVVVFSVHANKPCPAPGHTAGASAPVKFAKDCSPEPARSSAAPSSSSGPG